MFLHYLDLAWRSIRKTPGLSLLMISAIAIGIGITITTLNVYKMMAHNPVQHKNEQLQRVMLWSQGLDTWDEFHQLITHQDALNLRNITPQYRQAAMMKTGAAIQTDDPGKPAFSESIRVTDRDFFEIFDVPFLYGSAWDANVDLNPEYQVVVGNDFNKKVFGGGDNVGKTIYLDRKPYQIVGIIDDWNPQPKFYDLNNGAFDYASSVFVPFSLLPVEEYVTWGNTSAWRHEGVKTFQDRLNSEQVWIMFWIELNNEAQLEAYKQQLTGYIEQQKSLGRFTDNRSPADSFQLLNVEQFLEYNEVVKEDNKILVGLSFLFLLVCLVNILGLLLTKFLKRAPEVGVRRAIGASPPPYLQSIYG